MQPRWTGRDDLDYGDEEVGDGEFGEDGGIAHPNEDRRGWQHKSNINDETGFLDLELTISSSSVFREGVEVTVGAQPVEVAF